MIFWNQQALEVHSRFEVEKRHRAAAQRRLIREALDEGEAPLHGPRVGGALSHRLRAAFAAFGQRRRIEDATVERQRA